MVTFSCLKKDTSVNITTSCYSWFPSDDSCYHLKLVQRRYSHDWFYNPTPTCSLVPCSESWFYFLKYKLSSHLVHRGCDQVKSFTKYKLKKCSKCVTSNATHSPVHSLVNECDLSWRHKLHIWSASPWPFFLVLTHTSTLNRGNVAALNVEWRINACCSTIQFASHAFLEHHFVNPTRKGTRNKRPFWLSVIWRFISHPLKNLHKCVWFATKKIS